MPLSLKNIKTSDVLTLCSGVYFDTRDKLLFWDRDVHCACVCAGSGWVDANVGTAKSKLLEQWPYLLPVTLLTSFDGDRPCRDTVLLHTMLLCATTQYPSKDGWMSSGWQCGWQQWKPAMACFGHRGTVLYSNRPCHIHKAHWWILLPLLTTCLIALLGATTGS